MNGRGWWGRFRRAVNLNRQARTSICLRRGLPKLDGTFSQIVCIGLLEFSDQLEPRGAVAWYGGDERELLRQFWVRLAQNRPSLFITHNGLGFDFPFIKKRSIVHQVKPSLDINLARFRTDPVYDTMAIWG